MPKPCETSPVPTPADLVSSMTDQAIFLKTSSPKNNIIAIIVIIITIMKIIIL